jgi:hypothetical protein
LFYYIKFLTPRFWSYFQALKNRVQALVWQLIPQLETNIPKATIAATAPTSLRAPIQPSVTLPSNPYVQDPYRDGRGGFVPTPIIPTGPPNYYPQFPGVGGGDLNPSFPGMPSQPRPDGGTGSLVGPDHPIFNPNGSDGFYPVSGDYGREGGVGGFDPLRGPPVPGWAPGLPR